MKTKILCCALVWAWAAGLTNGQIRSDFVLISGGYDARLAFDRQGKLHGTWYVPRDPYNIKYGVFDSLGNVIVAPKTMPIYDGQEPSIAIGANHGVIAWRDINATDSKIVGRIFTVGGDTVPGTIRFSEPVGDTETFSADVTFLSDTTYMAVWTDNRGTRSIYGQIGTTSQRLIGMNRLLSDNQPDIGAGLPRVLSSHQNENLIVLWHAGRIRGRLFSRDGTPRDSSFLVSEDPELTQAWYMSAAIAPDGDFAVVWGGKKGTEWHVQWRRFAANGTPIGPSASINEDVSPGVYATTVDIAFDVDGKSVIVWTQAENRITKIYAQRFLPNGIPEGSNFRISALPDTLEEFSPRTLLLNGKLYTSWGTYSKATDFNTWANVIDFYNPPVSVNNGSENIPRSFHLFQNHPNPFNPTTTIKYSLSRHALVRLVIYDILGKQVIILKNEKLLPGNYVVQWNGKDVKGNEAPSGIYLYRLSVDGYSQTKKMALIR